MYTAFYSLTAKPFSLTPDPDFLYLSRSHKEALAHLTYGVESKSGFVMVTGEVGAGKTTLLRTLIKNLRSNVILSQVTNTRVGYKELLELILEDFGENPGGLSKTALLSRLNEFLIEQYDRGKNCVVIVDEAQNLGVPTLEGLRMLSNLETEKAKLLHIILSGQPGLRDLIDSPALEQLRQRITVRYHLGPLTVGEVGEYIRHRLAKVTSDLDNAPVFPDEVIPSIHEATGGIPRLVNVLCDAALLSGYVAEEREIGSAIVEEVAAQVHRDQEGVAPAAPDAVPERDSDVERRIAQIEARLESLGTAANPAGPLIAATADLDEEVKRLNRRESDLTAREQEVERRLQELQAKETEFEQRVGRIKDEWKRRMGHLEKSRREALSGDLIFPPLKVYAFDPDPRLQHALGEFLGASGIDVEIHGDFDAFSAAVTEGRDGGSFAVAVIGSTSDDAENVARVSALSADLAHVPTIFLSDIDLSTIRRRIFSAGANHFIEKPNGRATSFTTHRGALDNLKSDLLRAIQGTYRQYRAVFDVLRGGRLEGQQAGKLSG